MIELESLDKFEIKGRGTVFVIDLEKHNISRKRSEVYDLFLKKNVIIDGKEYYVRGVEAFMTAEDYVMNKTGLLVKEI